MIDEIEKELKACEYHVNLAFEYKNAQRIEEVIRTVPKLVKALRRHAEFIDWLVDYQGEFKAVDKLEADILSVLRGEPEPPQKPVE